MNTFNLKLIPLLIFCAAAQRVDAQMPQSDEGFTEPNKTVLVASPESGVLQELLVREGQTVRAGDILCKLDSQILEASNNAARQKLASQGKINGAQASLDAKRHHLQQIQQLFESEHASDKELKQAQLDFDLSKANLESTHDERRMQEMEIKRIDAQIERRVVRAPIAGVVLEIPHQQGEAITVAEGHVATIVGLNQLRVRYFLTTERAMELRTGDEVTVNFPDTKQEAAAVIDFVAPVTDSNSGTVRVELLIDNTRGEFRSGLRCLLPSAKPTARLTRTESPSSNR